MVVIQEFCLIPKKIINDLLNKSKIDPINTISIIKKQENIFSSKKPDLKDEIKKIFKNQQKYEKAISAYNWFLSNVPGIEINENGQVINPMKTINILEFLKHIYSESKTFQVDTLKLYKIWIALTDLPEKFVENSRIKEYAYSEFLNLNKNNSQSTKRKLPFSQMSTPKIAKKNDSEGPIDLANFKKFIKEVKKDSPYFTRKSKGKDNEKGILKASGGNFKWIKY